MRGGHWSERPVSSNAWATSPASPVEHFPDALLVPANPPRSYHVQTGHLSVANSKTAWSQCSVTSNTRLAPCLPPVDQGNHAASHPVQDCNVPQRKRNQDSAHQLCAVAGICKRKSAGLEGRPTNSFLPTWICAAGYGRVNWDSSQTDLTNRPAQFKPSWLLSPLTLALSPLRGEGIRSGVHEFCFALSTF